MWYSIHNVFFRRLLTNTNTAIGYCERINYDRISEFGSRACIFLRVKALSSRTWNTIFLAVQNTTEKPKKPTTMMKDICIKPNLLRTHSSHGITSVELFPVKGIRFLVYKSSIF